MNRISSIVPGVMAQTGMETQEIIHSIVKETKPDLVVAVDALAAREHETAEPYDPGDGYRYQSGKRSGKSQTCAG